MISSLGRALASVVAKIINALWANGSKPGRLFQLIYEQVVFIKTIRTPDGAGQFSFFTPNSLTLWRATSFYEKEPETLEWINSFEPGSVFYDIGANVGTYTIYAGGRGTVSKVLAFEPESSNYSLINKNVAVNGLQDKVVCLNIAVSDSCALDYLHLANLEIGGAMHSFASQPSGHGHVQETMFKQGMLSYSIDGFIATFDPPFPNYVKIDVDGLEKKVLTGAQKTLRDPRMKSVLVEIDEGIPEDLLLAEQVKSYGYRLLHKKHAPIFDGGPYEKIYNYIFIR